MKQLISKIRSSSALRLAAVAAIGMAASGCVYDGGVGLGYASDGYAQGCDSYDNFDSYYDYGYGFSNIGYGGGWYSDYYYPGYGYFIFDNYGRRYQMQRDHLRYWGGQRYNWYRQHGRNNYNNNGGYGHNNGGHNSGGNYYGGNGNHNGNGGHGGHDGGNGYQGNNGGHGGNGGHNGGNGHSGNGHNGNGGHDNNATPDRGQLDGGFGRPKRQPVTQVRAREGYKNYGNPAVGGTTNVAPTARNFESGNRGGKEFGGGFSSQAQVGNAPAPQARQAPPTVRAPAPQAAPRPAPQPRQNSIRNERSENRQED